MINDRNFSYYLYIALVLFCTRSLQSSPNHAKLVITYTLLTSNWLAWYGGAWDLKVGAADFLLWRSRLQRFFFWLCEIYSVSRDYQPLRGHNIGVAATFLQWGVSHLEAVCFFPQQPRAQEFKEHEEAPLWLSRPLIKGCTSRVRDLAKTTPRKRGHGPRPSQLLLPNCTEKQLCSHHPAPCPLPLSWPQLVIDLQFH